MYGQKIINLLTYYISNHIIVKKMLKKEKNFIKVVLGS